MSHIISRQTIYNLRLPTGCERMQGESSVDARPLEDRLHDEVVRSVDPEGVVAEPLAEDAVPL